MNSRGRRVGIVGAGPGGLSTAIAFHQAGFEVTLFERTPQVKAMGGAVLLNLPVLSILRGYGVNIEGLGAFAKTEFRNWKGKLRTRLPFNPVVEEKAGLPGWHYGMLRSAAFARMLAVAPPEIIRPGHACVGYAETPDGIRADFENRESHEFDLLVGADGIHSVLSRQAFGDPKLFHCGIQVWLGWCHCDDVPRDVGFISHSPRVQASYFPILHEGREAYEWWIVEPQAEGQAPPVDVRGHINGLLQGWTDPLPRLAAATDMDTNLFRWEIYNRPPLERWSKGRLVFVGDAVHPVSPYAAYGMGMAIEDGYFLAKALAGIDLSDKVGLDAGIATYEGQRVAYANKQTALARGLGHVFHSAPAPLRPIRDFIFDNTPFLERFLVKNYLKDAEAEMMAL